MGTCKKCCRHGNGKNADGMNAKKASDEFDEFDELDDFDEFDDFDDDDVCCCQKKKKLICMIVACVAIVAAIAAIIAWFVKRRKNRIELEEERGDVHPVAKAAGMVAIPLAVKDGIAAIEGKKEKKAAKRIKKKIESIKSEPERNYIPLNFEGMKETGENLLSGLTNLGSSISAEKGQDGNVLGKVKEIAGKLPTDKVVELAGKIRIEDAADMVKQARKKIGKKGYINMDELFQYKKNENG
ncbi:MAG: hypothetical protein IKR58_03210 [Lachnospiraceae bacterium]|nr:hypothetical protein [Lachnospiraceae bacterium]